MIDLKQTKHFKHFKAKLSNQQLIMLGLEIQKRIHEKRFAELELTILELGGQIRFAVYVDRYGQRVWILGGHWIRQGEPSAPFLNEMRNFENQIRAGKEPE